MRAPQELRPDTEPDTPSGPWIVPVLTLTTFAVMVNAMALGPFLPFIADEFGTSVALLGQVPAMSMLLAAVLGLVAGPIADHVGHRHALLGGLFIAVVSSAGIGLAPGYVPLLLAALAGAGARAFAQPIAVVIAGTLFRGEHQRRAISWVTAGATGAVLVGIPVLTTVAELLGWRVAFVALAGFTALLLFAATRIIDIAQARPDTAWTIGGMLGSYWPLLNHGPTATLIGAAFVGSIGIWLMATYVGAFYSERFGFSIQQIGWVYLVPGATLLIGNLLVGGRVGRLSLRPLVVINRILCGVAVAGLFMLPITALTGVGLLAVQGLTTGIATTAVAILLIRESPVGRATTMTLNIAAVSLGTAVGSALGGLLLAVSGFWLIGLFGLLFSCSSAGLVWWYQEPGETLLTPAAPDSTPA
jgi:MFS transporter, DHA1 family, inner membrane transport protein